MALSGGHKLNDVFASDVETKKLKELLLHNSVGSKTIGTSSKISNLFGRKFSFAISQ